MKLTDAQLLRIAQAALRYMENSLPHTHQGYRHVVEQQIAEQQLRIADLQRQAQQKADTPTNDG